ncbi:DNA gyrase C-terminal beta-propeller domain-containing protein [Candidatus Mycoplasma haematohominis]|uniref:DNA gyrase C-terminal beta-propeller domain-containing protein n=1 Tax=Candidatus Mycoplasma haematohominis TaxID=1494318 RepID=UPI001C0A6C92|nr:DNA gyrase C-terminal beta-propeller domain-containing protein [Candidatus Mycoplasma haemohominis]
MKGPKFEEGDLPVSIVSARPQDYVLFLTDTGRAYRVQANDIHLPENWKTTKARHVNQILKDLQPGDRIVDMLAMKPGLVNKDDAYLFIATKKGLIKKVSVQNELSKFTRSGKRVISFREGDGYGGACFGKDHNFVCLVTSDGQLVRFNASSIRASGRSSEGVLGVKLRDSAKLVSILVGSDGNNVFLVSSMGLGKQVDMNRFRASKRGNYGMRSFWLRDGDKVACASLVNPSKSLDLLLLTNRNKLNRFKVDEFRVSGRGSMGIKAFSVNKEESEEVIDCCYVSIVNTYY